MNRLKQAADELNLPLAERTMTYNSRRATELSKWAEAQGKGDEYHEAVFRAYFAQGLNIADLAVIKDLCRGLGLDPAGAGQVLADGTCKKAVDDDWAYSRRSGITAVPTFMTAGRSLVGAQTYDKLEKLVRAAVEKGPVSNPRLPLA